jgi:hypothetical protein
LWRLTLVFSDIAFHRRVPGELPASQFFFALILISYLMAGVLSLLFSDPAERLLTINIFGLRLYLGYIGLILLETSLDILFVWGVLKFFDHSKRFLQTAIALFGVQALLGIIRIPVLVWINTAREAGNEPTTGVFIYLALFLWTIDVAGFILAKAIQRTYVVGVLITIGYVMVSFSLRDYMFPITG